MPHIPGSIRESHFLEVEKSFLSLLSLLKLPPQCLYFNGFLKKCFKLFNFIICFVKDESGVQSHSDLDSVGSIPAIPNARNVPSLLCRERFNEASLPVLLFLVE